MSESAITETMLAAIQAVEVLQERMSLIREIKIEAIEAGRLTPIWSYYHLASLTLSLKLLRGMSWNRQSNYAIRRYTVKYQARKLADELGYDADDVTELLMSLMSPYM